MSEKKEVKDIRSRLFRVLLYPDNPKHMLAIIQLQTPEFPAVGIKHDKDVYDEDTEEHKAGEIEKEHYHFVLRFTNARYLSALAKTLGIEERFIQTARSYKGSVQYLVHMNDPEKYQYDTSELVGYDKQRAMKELLDIPEDTKVCEIIDFIDGYKDVLNVSTLFHWCYQNGVYGALRRSGWICKEALFDHNARIIGMRENKRL